MLLLLGTVGCDQATKQWAVRALKEAPLRSYFADTVRLQYTENEGAFLGLGRTLPPLPRFCLFTVLSGGALVVLLGAVARSRSSSLPIVPLSLLLGGGAANVLDRAIYGGRVVDFLNLGVGPLRTGIFNVADIAITTGVALVALGALRRSNERREP
jgi:signal peptidase II